MTRPSRGELAGRPRHAPLVLTAGFADERMLLLAPGGRCDLDGGEEEEIEGRCALIQAGDSGSPASVTSSSPRSSVTLRMSPLEGGR